MYIMLHLCQTSCLVVLLMKVTHSLVPYSLPTCVSRYPTMRCFDQVILIKL